MLHQPTASLDPATAECIFSIIEGLKREGTVMLAVFHHPETTRRLADRSLGLTPPAAVVALLKEFA